ncbi:TRAP transporter substrate-binding protein DctP [Acuticoccus sp. I52.16.1]|uniref:TRAP transporter substrate-binding protein DctP n=1 Tax=Acuticoccus sp. I52.16.1 TaxID=2928472 RepID=UPI001FD29549|nr:TRAP transporter substrate-binding protein DctP [Acuticoccus sp. I52.16.1]UOM36576.1 TRAP transporter substrate-binding protein DctP [Acuticoccus sp. I52.16.1]
MTTPKALANVLRATVFCALAALPFSMPVAAQEVAIDFASHLGPSGPQMQVFKWWADEVKSRSEGRIEVVNFFYSQSLVKAPDQLAAAGDGRATIVWTTPSYNPSDMPLATITEIPFMTENVVAWGRALEELYATNADVKAEFDQRGVQLLFAPPVGGASIGAKMPITKLEDLEGMKIRAFGYLSQALAAAGASPTGMSGAEIYEAVKRGVLDAYSGVIFEVLGDLKLYEVGPHLTGVGMGAFSQGVFLMNKDIYDGLPDDLKAIIGEVSKEASLRSAAVMTEAETAVCDTILAAGGTATLLPAAEVERWKEMLGDDILSNWIAEREARGLPAQAVADQWAELVAEYEAETDYTSGVVQCAERSPS